MDFNHNNRTNQTLNPIQNIRPASDIPIGLRTILTVAFVLNSFVGYFVFFWKQLPWNVNKLMQHIILCNFIQLIFAGTYDLVSYKHIQQLFMISDDCQLVYPIFSVTVNNPNLTTLAAFAFFLYNTCSNFEDNISGKTVNVLLVVGWISCLFLFSPQVFVTDLTQVDQECYKEAMTEITDMRVSFWIGILYFQLNIIITTLIYVTLCWRSVFKLLSKTYANITSDERNSTVATLLRSKYLTEAIQPANQTVQCDVTFELAETQRERTERFVINQNRRTVTFSDVSDSSSSPSYPSNHQQLRCYRMAVKRHKNALTLLTLLLASHIIGMVPSNYFFFWYYFSQLSWTQNKAFPLFSTTTTLSFAATILSPLAFMVTQRRIWLHLKLVLRRRRRFSQSARYSSRGQSSSCDNQRRSLRGNGMKKETAF